MKTRGIWSGIRPGDLWIVFFVLCAAAFLFFVNRNDAADSDASLAIVRTGTEEFAYPLSSDRREVFHASGYTLVLVIEDGSVRIASSDCPTQFCVESGAISRTGQCILCVPAGFMVKISGGGDGDADWILP